MILDDKLNLILNQLKELSQITAAIWNRQEETDTKLEALAMDVHRLTGKTEEIVSDLVKLTGKMEGIVSDLAKLTGKTEGIVSDLAKLTGKTEGIVGELSEFRNETNMNFSRFDRHMRAIEYDLDKTIQQVEQSNR